MSVVEGYGFLGITPGLAHAAIQYDGVGDNVYISSFVDVSNALCINNQYTYIYNQLS